MKLSQLKRIIKEQVRQLQNQKSSLREGIECPTSVEIACDRTGAAIHATCTAALEGINADTGACIYEDCCKDDSGPGDKPTYGDDPRLNIEPTRG